MTIRYFILLTVLLCTGCAALQSSSGTQGTDATDTGPSATANEPAEAMDQPEAQAGKEKAPEQAPLSPSFEPETLYDIIIAEMAKNENRLELSLGNYLKQANRTRDPGIILHAMQLAQHMHAHQATLDAAELLLEVEPNNIKALKTASLELIRIEQFEKALDYMDKILAADGEADFDFLVYHARKIDDITRNEVITALDRLLRKYPGNAKLWFTKALLAEQNKNYQAALEATAEAIDNDSDYISAKIAYAQLLERLERNEEAIAFLKKAVKQHSDNKRLQVAYARALSSNKRFDEAKKQFQRLVKRYPDDAELMLSLALISWKNGLNDQAKDFLNRLVKNNRKVDGALVYLGQIEASEDDYDEAIEYYSRVGLGPYYGTAQIQMALLLHKSGDLDGALTLLDEARLKQPENAVQFTITATDLLIRDNQYERAKQRLDAAIENYPQENNLLYSRAMLAEKMDRLDLLEQDLRAILEVDPDNAMALNALGYTLADRTDRYDEAFDLISRAYQMEPDDAAVIDSMGWVHYRLGNYDKALQYLRKAYQRFDDHEIAAHYGEVLWVTGNKEKALEVWRKALEQEPDSEYLKDIKERLQPEGL